jgi:hypothetical protein
MFARSRALFPRLERMLARQRRQVLSDFLIVVLVTVGLAFAFLAV